MKVFEKAILVFRTQIQVVNSKNQALELTQQVNCATLYFALVAPGMLYAHTEFRGSSYLWMDELDILRSKFPWITEIQIFQEYCIQTIINIYYEFLPHFHEHFFLNQQKLVQYDSQATNVFYIDSDYLKIFLSFLNGIPIKHFQYTTVIQIVIACISGHHSSHQSLTT